MKRLALLFIGTTFCLASRSQGYISFQDKNFEFTLVRDASIDSFLVAQPAYKALSAEEKEITYWINFVRTQPKEFYNGVLVPFLQQFPEVKSTYTASLISELQTLAPLPPLAINSTLTLVATQHAADLGKTGSGISHSSSNGKSFQERMHKAGLTNCIAENVYEGRQDALQSTIFLLIDHGVKNLGHRRNILARDNRAIGVAFHPIKNRSPFYFLVQDFSCEPSQ